MTRIDEHTQIEDACTGGCGGECGACSSELRLAADDLEAQATPQEQTMLDPDGDGDDMDVLTRGLLGSFARFIADGDDDEGEEHETEEVDSLDQAPEVLDQDPAASLDSDSAIDHASMDDAMNRVELALHALAGAMPSLEERLTDVEQRVDAGLEAERVEAGETEVRPDREDVATSLKDRLESVQRECDRLASVPIERVEARVEIAERTLGTLIERAESVAQTVAREREAAEHAADQLRGLIEALTPWSELLDLRETENGLPKPLSGLIRMAGGQLGREMASVRCNLDELARTLDLPDSRTDEPATSDVARIEELEEQVVAPQSPDEDGKRKPRRRKNGKARAVKAKGADAESPRRSASENRLTAAARLRARSRAEGRPPRR